MRELLTLRDNPESFARPTLLRPRTGALRCHFGPLSYACGAGSWRNVLVQAAIGDQCGEGVRYAPGFLVGPGDRQGNFHHGGVACVRSEERRVGKEGRSRWS